MVVVGSTRVRQGTSPYPTSISQTRFSALCKALTPFRFNVVRELLRRSVLRILPLFDLLKALRDLLAQFLWAQFLGC